jgi:flagellar basal body-associated protein FliL
VKGPFMPIWLLVLIIVLVVLFLFGGFGYRRR